jgi:hypothetical protein
MDVCRMNRLLELLRAAALMLNDSSKRSVPFTGFTVLRNVVLAEWDSI